MSKIHEYMEWVLSQDDVRITTSEYWTNWGVVLDITIKVRSKKTKSGFDFYISGHEEKCSELLCAKHGEVIISAKGTKYYLDIDNIKCVRDRFLKIFEEREEKEMNAKEKREKIRDQILVDTMAGVRRDGFWRRVFRRIFLR